MEALTKYKEYTNSNRFYKEYNFCNSEIIECNISDNNRIIITDKNKYNEILIEIWDNMDINDLANGVSFKLSTEKGKKQCSYKGYYYPSKSKDDLMREILNMVRHNNYHINIKIRLKNKSFIKLENKIRKDLKINPLDFFNINALHVERIINRIKTSDKVKIRNIKYQIINKFKKDKIKEDTLEFLLLQEIIYLNKLLDNKKQKLDEYVEIVKNT